MVIFGSWFWQLGLLHTKKLIKCSQSVTQTKHLRISAVPVVWKFNSATLITPEGEFPILYAWSPCLWSVFFGWDWNNKKQKRSHLSGLLSSPRLFIKHAVWLYTKLCYWLCHKLVYLIKRDSHTISKWSLPVSSSSFWVWHINFHHDDFQT